jgi:hypothetical protein
MENSILSAQTIYRQAVGDLFRRKHVVAAGLGFKLRGTEQTDELCLIVSVIRKVPASELSSEDLIPQAVSGLSTDVLETGRIRAQMPEDCRVRRRPGQPGISIGHSEITAGTFGLLVQRQGRLYILSNNHVLANSNAASIGDAIYQPGPADSGTAADKLATLAKYEPLDFGDNPGECHVVQALANLANLIARLSGSSHRLAPIKQTPGLNLMDAALALPDDPSLVMSEVLGIGIPTGVAEPSLGQVVQKVGRTTARTQGIVTQINVTVNVDYAGRTARFTDQVFATAMSHPGDSGSGILDMERQAVGLLFAGSERVTIFTPLQRILTRFDVELVTT